MKNFSRSRLHRNQKSLWSRHRACVYCGKAATTRDHVPARCLLDRTRPAEIFTVPACKSCNSGFSLDEEYLRAFVGLLVERDQTDVSPSLIRRIENSIRVDYNRPYIEPESDRVLKILSKIACGLYAHRYGSSPGVKRFTAKGFHPDWRGFELPANSLFTPEFRLRPWATVQRGSFSYVFARGWSHQLVCLLNVYDRIWGHVDCPEPPHPGRKERRKPLGDELQLDFSLESARTHP